MTTMTGEEKAGLLLLSLDQRVADAVLSQLGPEAKARLTGSMQRMKASPHRKDFAAQVFEEVERVLQKPALRVVDERVATGPGDPKAGPSLAQGTAAIGQKAIAKTAGQLPGEPKHPPASPLKLAYASGAATEAQDEEDPVAVLNGVAAERLLRALEAEDPKTIAVIMTCLTGEQGGEIFKQLQPGVRREVSVHMATCVMPGQAVVQRAVRGILAKEQSLPEVVGDLKGDARFKKMAQLMWKLERTERTEALAALQDRDPAAASQVRDLLYSFTDLLRLDTRSIQKVLGQTDGKLLAVALKGADDDVKKIVMDNMSKRSREGLMEEMEFLGTVPANQTQQAQKSIVDIIQQLDQAGELVMIR
jgi:flagellar motor switch protein FliG